MTTQINIKPGRNYISFPATSSDNFGKIFTDSGIKTSIQQFSTYNPILNDWLYIISTIPAISIPQVDISDIEYIDKGRGYILDISTSGQIIYSGEEYILTFNDIRSMLVEGWNLIGTGSLAVTSSNWCRIVDADTGFPIKQLQPGKAYWIFYNDCQPPIVDPLIIIFGTGLAISILSLWITLRKPKTQNIDVSDLI